MNNKDCSKGLCSLYCPQWCDIIFPPPPPFEEFPDESSTPKFSPLIITIIGILAGAFVLVSYYTIISKYCSNRFSFTRDENLNHDTDVDQWGDEEEPSGEYEPWFVTRNGLDEALIRSITVFKYKKGEPGILIEGTDCSVCLCEFEEDERLRLLPKCSHAFHVRCIDTWLKSHSNCPLCRANVAAAPPTEESPPTPLPLDEPLSQSHAEVESAAVAENVEIDTRDEEEFDGLVNIIPKTPSGSLESMSIEIRDELGRTHDQHIMRRSASMDNVLNNQGDSNCAMSPCEMKRSHSSGRWFSLSKCGRAPNSPIPL